MRSSARRQGAVTSSQTDFLLYRHAGVLFLFHFLVGGGGFFAYAFGAQDRPSTTSLLIGLVWGLGLAALGQAQLRLYRRRRSRGAARR